MVTSARATAIRRDASQAIVETTAGEFAAQQVVNCAGLYSDRVTRLSGVQAVGAHPAVSRRVLHAAGRRHTIWSAA